MKNIIKTFDLVLAGTSYKDKFGNNKYDNAEGSRAGSVFSLELEPDNIVDPLAIMVKFKNNEIGYIPKDENLEIAYYLKYPEFFEIECRQKKKIDNDRYIEMIIVIIKVYSKVNDYIPFSYELFDIEFPNYDNEVQERKNEVHKNSKLNIQEENIDKKSMKKNKGCLESTLILSLILILLFFLKSIFFP